MAPSLVPPGTDLCAIPAAVPPNGQPPNLSKPTSHAGALIAISIVVTIWALAFVIARVIVNRKKLNCSDFGMTFDIAYTGVLLAVSIYGRHQWDAPACWLNSTYTKLFFSGTFLIGPALYFSKSSIFLLYQQFFSVKRPVQIAIYIGLIATFLLYFPAIPLSIVYLAPHNGESWEELIERKFPKNLVYFGIVQGSLAVALDLYIFVLPLPTLSALHMSLKTRLQLIVVFATAVMGVIASVVALVYRVKLLHNPDSTWQQATVGIAVMVEKNVAIIVGSMPAVAVFMRVYISDSEFFKGLWSKVRGIYGDNWGKGSEPSLGSPDLATFGSPNVKKPASHELTYPMATATQTVLDEQYLSQINGSSEDEQARVKTCSTDRLV